MKTKNDLADRLGLRLDFLEAVARDHDQCYHVRDKKVGGRARRIFEPDARLRKALIPIKDSLRNRWLPPAIVGGRPGGTFREFAEVHVREPWILKLEIRNFYTSVRHKRVYDLFCDDLGCSPDVARLLTRLTTAEGHLPQGFHTSCDIGNLLIRDAANRIAGLAAEHDCAFSVWVDKMILSGPVHLRKLQPLAERIIARSGFDLSESLLVPKSKPQTICGVTVNTGLHRENSKRQLIEAQITEIAEGHMCCECQGDAATLHASLKASISHVAPLNPGQGRRLYRMLSHTRADWACRCGPALS